MIQLFLPLLILLGDQPPGTSTSDLTTKAALTSPCERLRSEGASYTVCSFDRNDPRLRLFLNDETGAPFGEFDAINTSLATTNQTLHFAMNAGMYHEDRSPVGLFIEDGKELARLQTGEGYGNFHLLPNGVFFVEDSQASVLSTDAYRIANRFPDFATQSGPMLVIDGALHPKFNAQSASFKRRNGVGIASETGKLFFVLTDGFVTFHQFATFFSEELGCENALYLDGSISRLYDAATGRNDPGLPMGPIVGIVGPLESQPD